MNLGYLSRGLKTRTVSPENQYARPGLRRFEIRVYGLLISSNVRSAARRRCARARDEHICVSDFGRPGPASAAGCARACRTRDRQRATLPGEGGGTAPARMRGTRPANKGARNGVGIDSNRTLYCAECPPSESILRVPAKLEVCGQHDHGGGRGSRSNCRLADHDGRGGDHRRRLAGDARPLAQMAGPFVLQQPEAIEDGI